MGFPHYRKDVQIVPFYDADLNAIAGLEDTLEIGHDGSEAANYQETLYGIVNSGRDFIEDFCNGADVAFLHKLITASAAHRLEAYLRVKELWKD